MAALGRYLFSVTSASIIFSILKSLLDRKSGVAAVIHLTGGLFLALTVISPILDFDFNHFFGASPEYLDQANTISETGRTIVQEQLREIIKERSEAYILDKAMSYQTPVNVEVTLDHSENNIPAGVQLKGSVSPYVKGVMTIWLQKEMGIPEENQIWIE